MTEIRAEGKDGLAPTEMVELMKQYIELPSELDYYLILEFSVLSRLRGYVPNDVCGYILIHGPSGTGKSHTAQFIVEISRGEWIQAISEGALLAGVSSGGMVGIDEIDGQIRRIETAEDILRVGHTWDATYRKMAPTENGFVPQDFKCGGPKVFTSIGLPQEALASRCYIIEMRKSDRAHEFCINWPYRKNDVLKIAGSLDKYADDIKKNIDGDELEKWHRSPEHLAELKKLKNVHARRIDLANVFTTVDHLLGWNVPGILEAMGKEALDDEKESIIGYLRELKELEISNGVDVENVGIKASKILEYVNRRRKDAGLRPFTPRLLGKYMTELGFTEPTNKIRRSDGIYYLFNDSAHKIFSKEVMTCIPSKSIDVPYAEQVEGFTSERETDISEPFGPGEIQKDASAPSAVKKSPDTREGALSVLIADSKEIT